MRPRRNSEEVRQAVIDAASRIIDENGPLRFRIADLLERAGVSESVVYRHFTDRDRLINETLLTMFERDLARTREATTEFFRSVDEIEPTPAALAAVIVDALLPEEGQEAVRCTRALKIRLAVAALEYPDLRERLIPMLDEFDALGDAFFAHIEERLAARGWAVSLREMRYLLNGTKLAVIHDDLRADPVATAVTRKDLLRLWTTILERFAGHDH